MIKLIKNGLVQILYLFMQWKCVNVWPNTKTSTTRTCIKCVKLNFFSCFLLLFLIDKRISNWILVFLDSDDIDIRRIVGCFFRACNCLKHPTVRLAGIENPYSSSERIQVPFWQLISYFRDLDHLLLLELITRLTSMYLFMQWKCVNVWPNTKTSTTKTCFKCAKLNFLITSSAVFFFFFLLTNWFHIGF